MGKYLPREPYDAVQWTGRNKSTIEKFLGITHVVEYDETKRIFTLDYDDVCRKGDYLVRMHDMRIKIYHRHQFESIFIKATNASDDGFRNIKNKRL